MKMNQYIKTTKSSKVKRAEAQAKASRMHETRATKIDKQNAKKAGRVR